MAKSLRSKSKRAFRAKKRTSNTSDYNLTETARLARLSQKLTQGIEEGGPSEQSKTDETMQVDEVEGGEAASSSKTTPKVSTHGPKMSGREVWKASKRGIQLRRAPATTVWHKRSTGKPQRRR